MTNFRHKDCFNPHIASDVIDEMLIMLENNEDSGLLDQCDLDSVFIEMAGSGYKSMSVTLQWLILYVASFPDVQEQVHIHLLVHFIEDNQLVIFDMKNISRGCVVRRWKRRVRSTSFFNTLRRI